MGGGCGREGRGGVRGLPRALSLEQVCCSGFADNIDSYMFIQMYVQCMYVCVCVYICIHTLIYIYLNMVMFHTYIYVHVYLFR